MSDEQDVPAGAARALLNSVIEVVLLFHSSSRWTREKQKRWDELTGGTVEPTTRAMCDWLREVRSRPPKFLRRAKPQEGEP